MKLWSFLSGFLTGFVVLSVCLGSVSKPAAVKPDQSSDRFKVYTKTDPALGQVTDDTALYQNLSEIRVAPEKSMDFDQDLRRLSKLENRYRERIRPLNARERMEAPMQRISKTQYRPASAPAAVRQSQSKPPRNKVSKKSGKRPRIGVPMNSH